MKIILKELLLFLTGGFAYYLIEIMARGFSHWTMFIVGGLCFVIIGLLNENTLKMPLCRQMLLSTLLITVIEFIAGCIINIYLGWNVWDYSDRPFNLFGQICLKNSLYWFFLSGLGIVLDDWIRYFLFDEEKPQYKLL